jgi:hypothetical protein
LTVTARTSRATCTENLFDESRTRGSSSTEAGAKLPTLYFEKTKPPDFLSGILGIAAGTESLKIRKPDGFTTGEKRPS